jgi:unsaturated rhamnogalacturonyl hydrolase
MGMLIEKLRRRGTDLLAGFLIFAALLGLPLQMHAHDSAPLPRRGISDVGSSPDWSRAIVDSTMKRYPKAADLGSWGYAKALFLFGDYLVSKRTGDPRYLQYIKDWVDLHVDAQGNLDHKTESLDSMMPGNLLLLLYQETREEKYKLAAEKIRARLDTYPRTADGGFWHATGASREHQLWGDGVFMSVPFLLRYGRLFGDSAYANQEAARQLLVYAKHLQAPDGLLYHAYDESGTAAWADSATHHSPEFWCRAMGWFGMTIIDTLDLLPANDPNRPQLIAILRNLIRGLAKYQDSHTGLWYQVVDKGSNAGNWLETSSSSMYSYVISLAIKRGHVDNSYQAVAQRGYRGVMTRLSLDADGMASISDICEGTNVADLSYYLARKRNVNDFHGLGAFLIMNEHFLTSESAMELTRPPNKTLHVAISNPTKTARVEDVVLNVAEVQRLVPDFTATAITVTTRDAAAAAGTASAAGFVEIPSQADDLDGDGKADEIAFQLTLQPGETRIVNVAYGGAASDMPSHPAYRKRTDARFAHHYDGMGWESENTAWRLYFDKRNAIDLWGKRKPGLYLETFAASDYKYQEEAPIGRDIYNVGKSLGAGGVGAWINGRAVPVADVSDRSWRIVASGPVRAIVEFTYKGWKIGEREVSLTSRITQWAGERGYEHRINLTGPESFPVVVGVSRKPELQESTDGTYCSLAIWGHQVVKAGTGATESLPDQNLGLALLAPGTPKDCHLDGDPMNYVVRPKLKDGLAQWYVLAAWDQEEARPVKSTRDFAALVEQESLRLSQPASVKILEAPQQSAIPGQAGASADGVRVLTGEDVRAAFEKGSPLFNKDGHNYSVLAGRRDKAGQAELHEHDLDIFYVLEGSATFITGGKMVDGKTTAPGEVRGSAIEGGEAHTLSKDNVIIIPPGVPHWFKDVQGLFLYYVVKVQQP